MWKKMGNFKGGEGGRRTCYLGRNSDTALDR